MPTTAARVPAKRAAKSTPVESDSDIEILSTDEDAGTFTAKVFGTDEEFTFYDDVNFLLLLIAYGGEGEDLAQLPTILKSMIFVADDTDEARRTTWQRFMSVLAKQRGMDAERSMKFINDLVAAAGKDQLESSDE
jgi:hypothetical protein